METKSNSELLKEFNELKKSLGYGERIPLFNLKFNHTYSAFNNYKRIRDEYLKQLEALEQIITIGSEIEKRGMQIFKFDCEGCYKINDVFEGIAIAICFLDNENLIRIPTESEYVEKHSYLDDEGEDIIQYKIKDYFLHNYAQYLNLEIKKCRMMINQYETYFINQWI